MLMKLKKIYLQIIQKRRMLKNKKVILGVTASIAAYKAASIVRELKKVGALVKVIQTDASLDFVTPLTLSTLSGNSVLTKMIDEESKDWNSHVELGQWADLMLIAPLTAKTMGKMIVGECDNLLLATYLSAKCPVYFAPAMDLDMYKHPSTKKNIGKLIVFGNKFIPAQSGELASGLVGEGRMAEPEDIIDFIQKDLASSLPFSGKKVLITAGPTHEPLDPIRFIGNRSSGKMGYHLAMQAADMGADVTLVMGPSELLATHSNLKQIDVNTAAEMYKKAKESFKDVDIAIFAAAVSDYKIKDIAKQKVKKDANDWQISLTKTTDILQQLTKEKTKNQFVVGFALETEDELVNAKEKLVKKNLDMIVLNSLNDKGAGFITDSNKITIIEKDNNMKEFELKHKQEVALDILHKITEIL